jgi:hypothetical protein
MYTNRPKCCSSTVTFIKLPKVNNRPLIEFSPNLVTLVVFFSTLRKLQQCKSVLLPKNTVIVAL